MLDQKTRDRPTAAPRNTSSRWLMGLVAMLALVVVGLTVWALSERSQVDELSADLSAAESQITELEAELEEGSAIVVVGDQALTPRQEQMVAMVAGPWAAAWDAADSASITAMFTSDGVMYDIDGGDPVTIADGTLEAFARRWPGLTHMSGMLVHGDRVITVVELAGNEVGSIIDFTEAGDLAVESVAMYDSELGPNR